MMKQKKFKDKTNGLLSCSCFASCPGGLLLSWAENLNRGGRYAFLQWTLGLLLKTTPSLQKPRCLRVDVLKPRPACRGVAAIRKVAVLCATCTACRSCHLGASDSLLTGWKLCSRHRWLLLQRLLSDFSFFCSTFCCSIRSLTVIIMKQKFSWITGKNSMKDWGISVFKDGRLTELRFCTVVAESPPGYILSVLINPAWENTKKRWICEVSQTGRVISECTNLTQVWCFSFSFKIKFAWRISPLASRALKIYCGQPSLAQPRKTFIFYSCQGFWINQLLGWFTWEYVRGKKWPQKCEKSPFNTVTVQTLKEETSLIKNLMFLEGLHIACWSPGQFFWEMESYCCCFGQIFKRTSCFMSQR